ncbi:MAG: AAA family ATPase [Myxococcota bacterium]|nr:AAA family ATPase [Myxococcota bacterium]
MSAPPTGKVVLVSGCPGCGKTSLSAVLAKREALGFHLVSDHYYEFVAHKIDPTKPESRAQNEAIMRALAASSAELARSGYAVFLDGVIGPWMLPEYRPFLAELPTHYVVLEAPEPDALRRVRERDGPGLSPIVRHMHRQFADLGPFAGHAVASPEGALDAVADEVATRLAAGELALDWSRI